MAVGRCPQCDGKLDIPKKHSGKQICCAHCQHIFVAPSFKSEPVNPAQASAMASAVNSLPLPNALQPSTQADESVTSESVAAGNVTAKHGAGQASDSVDQSVWPPGSSAPNSPAIPATDGATTSPASLSPAATAPAATTPAATTPAATTPARSAAPENTTATIAKVSPSPTVASPQTEEKNAEQKEKVSDTEPETKKQARTVKIRRPKTESRSPEAKLPSLSLTDKPRRKQIEMPGWKSNPIFLGVLFCISMIASAAVLLVDIEPPKKQRKTNAEARVQLQEFYEVRPGSNPEPYQVELRSAQLAHSRGDRKAELRHYRNVMTYLRAEDRNQYTGLTGSSDRDAELESYLSGLLSEPD